MKRTYDKEARNAIEQLLRNAIKALRNGFVNDPGDLGGIAAALRELTLEIAEESHDEVNDTEVWFDEATPCFGLQQQLEDQTEKPTQPKVKLA